MIMGSVTGVMDMLFGYLLGLALSKSEFLRVKLTPSPRRIAQVEGYL